MFVGFNTRARFSTRRHRLLTRYESAAALSSDGPQILVSRHNIHPLTLGILAALLIGASAFLLFFRLGEEPAFGDETAYMQVAARTWRTQHWAPLLGGDRAFPWKPPISVWASAAGIGLLGENELGARLLGGLAGIATCALVGWLGWRHRNTWTMVLATLAFVTAPPLLLEHGLRSAVPEPWLLLFTTASFAIFLESPRLGRRRVLVGLALLSVLSGLTKSIVGPAILGLALFVVELLRPASGGSDIGRWPRFRRALTTAAAASVPGVASYAAWIFFSLGIDGALKFVSLDLAQRASSGIDPIHLQPPSVYLDAAIANFGPFALLAPLVLALQSRGFGRRADDEPSDFPSFPFTLLVWILVVFTLFGIPRSRLSWYVYPAYPALALATASSLDLLRSRLAPFRAGRRIFVALLAALCGLRAQALQKAWPEQDPTSLAALQHLLDADPNARVYTEAAIARKPEPPIRLPSWHRFYLRRFTIVDRPELPEAPPECSFVVTADPLAWRGLPQERLVGTTALRGTRPNETQLYILDLCQGRLLGRNSKAER